MAQQVTCIVKRGNHYNPHERIEKLGNTAEQWMMNEDTMIRKIEGGSSYYTYVNGKKADIVIATKDGRKYLKTTADGYSPDNLLALAECKNCKVVS